MESLVSLKRNHWSNSPEYAISPADAKGATVRLIIKIRKADLKILLPFGFLRIAGDSPLKI
jgi:hypothetical protein